MKNKIKIFLALSISLITTLIFTISTFAQAGYEITNNNNIESKNLFNIKEAVASGSNINTNTGIVSGYDTKTVFNFQVQWVTENYIYTTIHNINITTIGTYSFTFTKTNSMYYLQFGHNGSSADIKVRYDIHNLENTTYTITINVISIYNPQSFNNIMLNKGNTALNYFPYGNYTNNDNIGNNGQIYEQLNGTTAKLFQTNITNINTALNTQGIIEETVNINNQTSYTWNSNSINTIENCIINYNPAINLGNRATVLLQLKNPTIFENLTFTRIDKNEDRYIYLYNQDKKLITTLTIARKVENITQKI